MDELKVLIRTVPDFPKKGIMFKDITPLLQHPEGLRQVMKYFKVRYKGRKIKKVAGIESRGFIFGAALAHMLGVGFIPIRKPNKLPAEKERVEYALEYGTDALEIHRDAILLGEKVLVVDDLIATAGTLIATIDLIEKLGGEVVECATIIELSDLHGRDKIETRGHTLFSMLEY